MPAEAPHHHAFVSCPAKQFRVDRPHECVHAIETFGSRAGPSAIRDHPSGRAIQPSALVAMWTMRCRRIVMRVDLRCRKEEYGNSRPCQDTP
jgi:hypothetical protein